jgi:hypothetical protein
MANVIDKVSSYIPDTLKNTALLRTFGLAKVPLIFLVRPSVQTLNGAECSIKIPLNRLTRNHLNSMYFGTLAIGADAAGGLLAIKKVRDKKIKASIVFKNFSANFLKRPEGDTVFTCREGELIDKMIETMIATKERVTENIKITATVPSLLGSEPVAEFELGLSLKPLD